MKKKIVLYIAVVSFCLFFLGCKVSVTSSYETKLLAPMKFSAKGGNGCVMLVWDLPEENTSEEVEYFVEYDGKTVPVDKSACCKKISDLKNGTEYTFSLYGQKMQSGKKGYVSTAKATPSEDGLDMAESVHQGYVVWFNLYERKDKKTCVANNTNDGRIVWPSDLASSYDPQRDISAYEDNYTEVEKLIVRVPSNITDSLRENEAIHWWCISRPGYRYEVCGYIYNTLFEASDAPYYDGEYPVEFDTVASLQSFNKKFEEGKIIRTLGYFEKDDGGGTQYITAERTNGRTYSTLRTATGQIVNIDEDAEFDDRKLNFRQLGAGVCRQITYEMRKKYPDENFNLYTGSDPSIPKYNDDVPRLFEAIELLRENRINADEKITLYVPSGSYRCGGNVSLGEKNLVICGDGMPYSEGEEFAGLSESGTGYYYTSTDYENKNISPYKCSSIFYTDNYYTTWWEFFFQIWGAENLTLDKIRIEARETKYQPYYRQLVVLCSDNVCIKNCEVYNDENVHKYEDEGTYQDKQFTTLTFYSGAKNCVADNNVLYNMCGVDRGASAGVMDFYGDHTKNITISNNIMYQNCHDELLGVFSSKHWYKPDASVEGVYIRGNKLYPQNSAARRRTMVVTMAYDDSYNITDVVFEKNYIAGEFPSNCMTFGHFGAYGESSDTEYCTIQDNVFDMKVTASSGVIFDSRRNVVVKNNTINFVPGSTGLCTVFKRGGLFTGNTVNVSADASIGGIGYTAGRIEKNTFNIEGKCWNLTNGCFNVKDNVFNIAHPMTSFFSLPNANENAIISGNTVNYNIPHKDDYDIAAKAAGEKYYTKGWEHTHVLSASVYPVGKKSDGSDVWPTESFRIEFTGNTINAPYASTTNKHLVFFGKGTDPNEYIITGNKTEKFTWVRSQMGSRRNITYDNTTTAGVSLLFSQEESGENNYVAGNSNVSENGN